MDAYGHRRGRSPGRSQIFGDDAETYDAARPTYPAGAIDIVTQDGPATAVDVGCGTGKFGRLVAARGTDVLGTRARPAHGRRRPAPRDDGRRRHVRDVGADDPGPRLQWSGLALGRPVRGAARAAEVLPAGGRWAACWNREEDPTVRAAIATVAGRVAPSVVRERTQTDTDHEMAIRIAEAFADTGQFGDVEQLTVPWTDTVTVATLVARLSTRASSDCSSGRWRPHSTLVSPPSWVVRTPWSTSSTRRSC